MNRRRTIERRKQLFSLWRAPRNRRLQLRREEPARPPRNLGGVMRGVARAAIAAGKIALALTLLGAVGLGGYHGYRRLISSTYFCVKHFEVQGARRAPVAEVIRLVESTRGKNIFTVDLGGLSRSIQTHPWIKTVRVTRRLPHTISIDLVEQRAQALLLLGHLYLVNQEGQVFMRVLAEEGDGLPIITGIERLEYLNDPAQAGERIRRALAVLDRYYGQVRPSLSEISIGTQGEVTLFLRHGGAAIRLGSEASEERLARFDRVWAALGPETGRARVFYLDNEVRADWVTVRLASNQ